MITFFLYIISGIATLIYVGALLLLRQTGGVVSSLEYLALAGTSLLIAGGAVALVRPQIGGRLALVGALGAWSFFLPALRNEANRLAALSAHIYGATYALATLALLAVATLHALLQSGGLTRPAVLFGRASRRGRRTAVGALGLIMLTCALMLVWSSRSRKQQVVYVFPEGYVGWVRIDFGVSGAGSLPGEGKAYVLRIPPDGVMRTSLRLDYTGSDNVYLYAGEATKPAHVSTGFVVKRQVLTGEAVESEYLFVGSQEQHDQYAMQDPAPNGLPRPGPVLWQAK